jgi:hypothetical protein
MTAMQNVQETNLAWALIDAIKPHLNASERKVIFVVIGAGDTFSAIRRLFELIVLRHIALRAELVKRCMLWLNAYAGHEEEPYLRRLTARLSIEGKVPSSVTRLSQPVIGRRAKSSVPVAPRADCDRTNEMTAVPALLSTRTQTGWITSKHSP